MTAFLVIVCALAGFGLGKLHERYAWTELIKAGVLPKPGWTKRND